MFIDKKLYAERYVSYSFCDSNSEICHLISNSHKKNVKVKLTNTSSSSCVSIDKKVLQNIIYMPVLKIPKKCERKVLKVFLLGWLQKLFRELFKNKMNYYQNHSAMEFYHMDSKIIQFLIQGIIDSEEYTLEGIAFETRIPFDVIYDAACGINNQISITPWAKLVDLYMQVNPAISQVLIEKLLLEVKNNNQKGFSSLLAE